MLPSISLHHTFSLASVRIIATGLKDFQLFRQTLNRIADVSELFAGTQGLIRLSGVVIGFG